MAQTANILQILSIVFFALAGIALVIAIIIFFYYKIPKVAGDLSGKTARKSINRQRAENEKAAPKGPEIYSRQAFGANASGAADMAKKAQSAPQPAAKSVQPSQSPAPSKQSRPAKKQSAQPALSPADISDTEQRSFYEGSDIPETGLLKESRAGSEVDLSQTTLLNESEETTWLNTSEETTLLEETAELGASPSQRGVIPGNVALELIEEIMFIHTDEEI